MEKTIFNVQFNSFILRSVFIVQGDTIACHIIQLQIFILILSGGSRSLFSAHSSSVVKTASYQITKGR